jgi:hypothetical protein
MAIVAGLFAGLFGRLLGRRKGAVAAVIAIALYTVLVGPTRRWCGQLSWAGWESLLLRSGGAKAG